MIDIFEVVKSWVNIRQVIELLNLIVIKGKIACPFHQDKTPSLHIYEDTNSFHCFGCGVNGDVIQFVALYKNLSLLEAAKLLAKIFNVPIDSQGDKPMKKDRKINEYINYGIMNVGKTDFFKKRGLTEETVIRHYLGFDPDKNMAITPHSFKLEYYISRNVDKKEFSKPKVEEAGPEPLFYEDALYNKKREPIFVTESPLCTISIYQCQGVAVSLCGTGNKKLIDAIIRKRPIAPLIICLDNDEAGDKASKELCSKLLEMGINYIVYNIADECKDPNELLITDPERLKVNIDKAKAAAIEKFRSDKDSISAIELMKAELKQPDFLVDKMLPVGLAIICAPSKAGKSWMMLQMCIAIASGQSFIGFNTYKNGCIYYTLEDSKVRLQDRMRKVLNGKSPPDNCHFCIKADPLDNGLLEQIKNELDNNPGVKLVIIDTLQKVRGRAMKNESTYSSDYREMAKLKDFADKNEICILLVHHLRKMKDDDVFNMISGSTGIMGACDTIFTISKKKRSDENAVLSMTGRDIYEQEIVIRFNKASYQWEVVGCIEDEEAKAREREYNDSPVIKTIKALMDKHPYGWEGSISNLLIESAKLLGHTIAETSSAIGRLITKYEPQLMLDGIHHKFKRAGSQRIHIFTRANNDNKVKQMEVNYEK